MKATMVPLILHWLISAASLIVAAYLIPGITVVGFGSALVASVAIGFVNATVGTVLKIVTLPLSLLTFGLFFLVINALMLQLAAYFVPGFFVAGFGPAFFGAIVLSLVSMMLRSLFTMV